MPVEASDGTAARTEMPALVTRSTSTVMGVAAAARILRANMLLIMNLLASKVLMASHVLGLFA